MVGVTGWGSFTAGVIITVVAWLIVVGFIAWAIYAVVRQAVRDAMDDHYRKVQWYEHEGLWYSGKPPKGMPGVVELSRGERRGLPKDERPERGA